MSSIKLVHQTRLVSPKSLMANPKNAAIHPDSQVSGLAESFRRFGFIGSVLVGDNDTIVAGHGRVLAAELAGMKEIPVIDVTHLSPEEQDALMIVDNKVSEGKTWDQHLLDSEMERLSKFDFNFDQFGFVDKMIEELSDYPGQPEHTEKKGVPPDGSDFDRDEDEDGDSFEDETSSYKSPMDHIEIDPLKNKLPINFKSRVSKGDIWILGNHKIACGSSTDPDLWKKLLNNTVADLCFTSPPYNAGKPFKNRNNGNLKESFYQNSDDNLDDQSYMDLLTKSLRNSLDFCDASLFNIQFLNGNKKSISNWVSINSEYLLDVMVAIKNNAVPAFHKNQLSCGFEMIYAFSKNSKTKSFQNAQFLKGTQSNVFRYPKDSDRSLTGIHDARFPMEFANQFIQCFSASDSFVIDPFLGSGTTLIACENLKRKCLGIELDPHYCDLIIARFEQMTGQTAVRSEMPLVS